MTEPTAQTAPQPLLTQDMVQDMAQGLKAGVSGRDGWLQHFAAFQDFIKTHQLEIYLSALIVLAVALAVSMLVRTVGRRIIRLTDKRQSLLLKVLPAALTPPVQWLVWLTTVEVLLYVLKPVRQLLPAPETSLAFGLAYIGIITLALLRINRRYFRTKRDLVLRGTLAGVDLGTLDLLTKILVVCIMVLALLLALPLFGISIGGLLAIGGVGGAIAGFAVKDTLANVFGAISINIDQPFRVGDWVKLPDHNIEGIVEEVGWGQTTIRKFDKRPVYVPNAVLTNAIIENPGRMTHRRILEKIGLRYDDFKVLPQLQEALLQALRANADLAQDQLLTVRFLGYGAYTLDLEITAYTHKTAWLEFLAVHQGVLLTIGRLVAEHGAELAFPTQTVINHDTARAGESKAAC